MRRVLLPLLAAFVLWRALPVAATEYQPGLTVQVWNNYPSLDYEPWANPPDWEPCYTGTVEAINFDWGGGSVLGCDPDFVLIHFTGFITVPTTGNYSFLSLSDDGWRMSIGETIVNANWVPKGCGGWWSEYVPLQAGVAYPLDAWWYEWGGGACTTLLYQMAEPYAWDYVPAAWYSISGAPSPSIEPSPSVSPSPTEVPSNEPSQTPPPTPEPTASPSVPVEPTPTISIEPSPTIEPSPSPSPTPSPLTPPPSPVAPSPTPTPIPSPETPTPSPSAPVEPSPEPTPEPSPDNPAEAAAVLVGEAAQAVAEAVGEAAAFVANLGHDISPEEKRKAAATIVPAIIITQVAQAAVAAAATAAATGSAARKVK